MEIDIFHERFAIVLFKMEEIYILIPAGGVEAKFITPVIEDQVVLTTLPSSQRQQVSASSA